MHSYGPDTAAAATMAFNWDAIAFIPMLGLGIATTSIIGQLVSAGKYDDVEMTVKLIIRVSLIYSAVMITLFVGFAGPLISVFSSGLQDADGKIAQIGMTMLRLMAVYTIANSTKLVLSGTLRAAGDTTWVMVVSIVIHWLMAAVVIIFVRVLHINQFAAWSVFLVTMNVHALSVFYRYKTGKWKSIKLIN